MSPKESGRCQTHFMHCVLRAPAAVLVAAAVLTGCQTDSTSAAGQIAPPVVGQAANRIEGSGQTDQDYSLIPGSDGRVFLVLDCAAAEDTPSSLTARRADGTGWGPASTSPDLSVVCDSDGERLAILGTGTPGVAIPLAIRTAGDTWRVSQTYQRPNG